MSHAVATKGQNNYDHNKYGIWSGHYKQQSHAFSFSIPSYNVQIKYAGYLQQKYYLRIYACTSLRNDLQIYAHTPMLSKDVLVYEQKRK